MEDAKRSSPAAPGSLLVSLAFICVCSLLPFSLDAAVEDDCASCHGKRGTGKFVDADIYAESVHGRLPCKACHLDVARYPHGRVFGVNCVICHFTGEKGAPRVREYKLSVHYKALREGNKSAPKCQTCHGHHDIYESGDPRSQTARQKIPQLCSGCHPREYADYSGSVHAEVLLGGKRSDAATCFDCHMEHLVPPAGQEAWKLSLIKNCGGCHREELETYRKTFHGKVTRLGYTTVAKCSDCHGFHGILRVRDKDSTLSASNIVNTCRGGNCHPRATIGFTKFYAHAEESNKSKYPSLYYTYIFMTTLLVGVFSFFFIHTFLWAYRALKESREERRGGSK